MRILVLAILTLSGCISSDDQPKDLDISMNNVKEASDKDAEKQNRKRMSVSWESYFKRNPNEKQKLDIQKAVNSDESSESYDALIKKAHNQLAIGLIKNAELSFRQANRKDETKLEPILEIARIHLRRHEVEETIKYLAHIKSEIEKREETEATFIFRYRYLLALTKVQSNDISEGRVILRDLISIEPDFAPGYVSLATTYLKEGNVRAAEFIIRRGMDRSKPNANFYGILAAIDLKKERVSSATRNLEKAIELDPNNILALINRSNIAIENLEFERAELDLQKALSINPDNTDALISLAIVQKKTGRVQSAKGTLSKAIDVNPHNALARFHLADLYLNNLDDAEYAMQLFYEVLQSKDGGSRMNAAAQAQIAKIKESRL